LNISSELLKQVTKLYEKKTISGAVEEALKDVYATVKKTLGVSRLEPHVYSDSEYERMKKTINKMTKNGIVLCRKICGFP